MSDFTPKITTADSLVDPQATPSHPRWRLAGEAIVFQVGLFLSLLLGAFVAMRLISLPPTNVTVIWLPAGIALLALRTRHARASLPTILVAHWAIIAIANDYSIFSFRPWSLVMAAANTAGPMIGAWIWRRFIPATPFRQSASFLRFIVGAALVPALLTAWVIPTVILTAGFMPDVTVEGFLTRVGSITLSSILGVFLLVPIVQTPWNGGLLQKPRHLWLGHTLNVAIAALIGFIGFNVTPMGLYLAIPFGLASAYICGPRGLGLGLLLVSVYGLLATTQGLGPFASTSDDPVTNLFEMAAAVLCLGIPGCYSGLTLNELRRHRLELEKTIAQRTQEFRDSEERYRLATEAVAEGVFDWRRGNSRSFYNPSIVRNLGNAVVDDRVIWARVWRNMHPDDRRQMSDSLRAFMFGEAKVFRLEGRVKQPSNRWRWFRIHGKVIERDEQNRASRIVGVLNDIEEDKRRLHSLAQARDDADSRGRSKDTFLANMSHEIRTPMHAMLGFTRVLDSSKLDEKQRECVDAILSSGDLLLELLNDLLDLSRIEAGAIQLDPTADSLHVASRQTIKLFESRAAQKGIDLNLHIQPNVPPVLEFDRLRVHQVVSNLLSNAIKFTDSGKVEMSIRASKTKPTASNGPCRISIEISDTGIGITDDQVSRLFNPFVQADSSITRKFGGTGLGLAISQRLCELMGGTISVTSKPGQGSMFTATFSAKASRTCETTKPNSPTTQLSTVDPRLDSSAPLPALQVLVVEDNRLNRRLAGMMLQKLGHQAQFAENGLEALEQVDKTPFDLILMDLQMPELDGFEATRAIRLREATNQQKGRRAVPIIALTANAESEERSRCIAAGMDDFLTKPLDMVKFRSSLEHIQRELNSS